MKKRPPEFIFLKDEPQTKSEVSYERFYHNSIAPALKKILQDKTSPHTIGLFGAWGAGKSTVIEMVKNDSELDMPVFIFDAWKYKDDTLRRTFLIKLVDFLKDNKIKIDENILTPLYNSTTNSTTKNSDSDEDNKKPWYKKLWAKVRPFVLLGTLIVSVIFIILFNTVWQHLSVADLFNTVLSFIASVSVLVVILKPAVEEIVKAAVGSLFSKQISQTEIITKTIQQDKLNSPEQFETKFIEILEHVDKKMVIVFDNIDRVQGDVAISMLTTIKTFMYSSAKNGLVFIVPCDPAAIEVQVEKYFYGSNEIKSDSFGAAEYLRKIFNLIIWIPDFINTDLEQYTKDVIGKTGEISNLLDDEDVILVINSAFSRNPREIIQFINNLIAMVISTRGTGVKDIIDGDIAYLAKVLIIRQKFPKAYESLKESWHQPESITNGEDLGERTDFTNFMQKTSRITVDDAEPFIYFKDPVDSRGLKNANLIKNALIAGNVTEAQELSKDEPQDKLVEFMADLAVKYSGQENIQSSVVITQFEIISSLGIPVDSKRYVNDIAKTIDTELWQKYESLPLSHVFNLLLNKKINPSLRVNIITRYLGALGSNAAASQLNLDIIEAFKNNPNLLNSQQKTDLRSLLESKYATNNKAIQIFNNIDGQETFITEKLINTYISSFTVDNVATNLTTIDKYKTYIIKHNLLADLIRKIAELLSNEIATSGRYDEGHAQIISSIEQLVKTFRNELKSASVHLSQITQDIIQLGGRTSQQDQRADQVVALYWLRNYVEDTDRDAITASINSYFQSYPDLASVKQPLELWTKETRKNFIKLILPTILPNLVSYPDVLSYIYTNSDLEEQKKILHDVIDRTPSNNYYDIDFIGSLNKIPDRKNIIAKLLDKAKVNSYTHKEKYFTYVASQLPKSDITELKSALEQVTALITSNDPAQSDIAYSFLSRLSHLQETDKRRIATDLLNWLREPGRSISAGQNIAFKIINDYYPLLQPTPKNDYIYLLFSLLTETQDPQTLKVIMDGLEATRPTYKTHKQDFDDLTARIKTWQNTSSKMTILRSLPSLTSPRQSQAEKKFWDDFANLYPEDES